jgi:hypothetical protein
MPLVLWEMEAIAVRSQRIGLIERLSKGLVVLKIHDKVLVRSRVSCAAFYVLQSNGIRCNAKNFNPEK